MNVTQNVPLPMNIAPSLLFQHGDFRPAGGAFREFSGGEAPDHELLALDPVRVLGGFAVNDETDQYG